MSERPLEPRAQARASSTRRAPCARSSRSSSRSSTSTRSRTAAPERLELNDIGVVAAAPLGAARRRPVRARTARPGAFILIDEATNDTVGAGMIVLEAS